MEILIFTFCFYFYLEFRTYVEVKQKKIGHKMILLKIPLVQLFEEFSSFPIGFLEASSSQSSNSMTLTRKWEITRISEREEDHKNMYKCVYLGYF